MLLDATVPAVASRQRLGASWTEQMLIEPDEGF